MGMCKKCSKGCGLLVLVFGVLFLLQDLMIWDFWGINWWTAAFILLGIGKLGSSSCKCCGKCDSKGKKSGEKDE